MNLSTSSIDNLILTCTFTVKRKFSSSKPQFHYQFLQQKRSSSQA
jgi:hypothetical protein